mmetsp:Transcript_1668/g.4608  ORF Transcript_1668/g.4608 Transcript_1668/m.4608 type:complete len:88 (+) Transcript_1668:427-690(+)
MREIRDGCNDTPTLLLADSTQRNTCACPAIFDMYMYACWRQDTGGSLILGHGSLDEDPMNVSRFTRRPMFSQIHHTTSTEHHRLPNE